MPENQLADLRRRLNDLRREIDEIGRREVPPSGGGFVTLTGAQTVAGVKTFSDDVIAAVIRRATEVSNLTLMGGTSTTQGPYIQLIGKDVGGSDDGKIIYVATTESGGVGEHIWFVHDGASTLQAMKLTSSRILQPIGISFGNETLNAYDEGTFTPVVADSISGGNLATGSFSGWFTKIGHRCWVDVRCENIVTTGMTGANALIIRNLPYAAQTATGYKATAPVEANYITHSGDLVARISSGLSGLDFYNNVSNTTADVILVSDVFSSGFADVWFSISYITA